ncbi:MAG TPA: hypothetical protein VN706_14405 [Gemmatimonadaceae bacterium]|nr:hypothetical protein [Gemmatimonadaceae bacterium]
MHIRSATLLTLLPISAFAQATLVARDPVDGLSLAGTTLVWKSDCGGDLATAARVRFMDTRGTSIVTTYFSDACDANRPASTRAVADNDFVYWLTGAGAVVRAPLVPVPGSAPQQIAHTSLSRIAGYPSCCSIAVDDHYVYWTETNAVWRVAKGGGTPIVIARASGTRVTDVQATSGASPRVFYIDVTPGGGRLRALLPASANTYFPLPAGESVVAYALSTDHLVYVSAGDQGAYTVFSRSLPSLASATTLFHDDGALHPAQRIDAVAVDAAHVYWHVAADRTGGPLMRLSLGARAPVPVTITDYQLLAGPIVSDGRFVYWFQLSEGVYRLGVDAPAVVATSRDRAIFTATDVSPDRPWNDHTRDVGDPTGRTNLVVVDPTNPSVLYAATDLSGVWKSTDAGHSWIQSSYGMEHGVPSWTPALAVDPTNSRRLVYATDDDEERADGRSTVGIYVSTDAAATWHHVAVDGCDPGLAARQAIFVGGSVFVATRCGIVTSTDLAHFTTLSGPWGGDTPYFAARGQTLYTCNNTSLYRSTTLGASWERAIALPNRCIGIAAPPDGGDPSHTALVLLIDGGETQLRVFSVDASSGSTRDLGFRQKPDGSGRRGIFVAPRVTATGTGPLASYDVFVGNGLNFFGISGRNADRTFMWAGIATMHVDTWSMAFPSTYDPARGVCTAYASNDGGIYAYVGGAGSNCITATGPFGRAMSGLHALGTGKIYGIRRPGCSGPPSECVALYVPTGDNDLWASWTGGATPQSWNSIYCCGDASFVVGDPARPSEVMTGRNTLRLVLHSVGALPPAFAEVEIGDSSITDGSTTQVGYGAAPVVTPRGETPPTTPVDYVTFRNVSPIMRGQPANLDMVVRMRGLVNRTFDVSPGHDFPYNTVSKVGVSGGHVSPVYFVLTTDGRVIRGRSNSVGLVTTWETISPSTMTAQSLWVNPYDPQEIWVTATHDIESTRDGGLHWNAETHLTAIATANGTQRFTCRQYFCPLQQVLFVHTEPDVRIAVLHPRGLAFSRDRGLHWTPIERLRGLNGLHVDSLADVHAWPQSAWYDPAPQTNGWTSLYVAFGGRSVIRLDGPFESLTPIEY